LLIWSAGDIGAGGHAGAFGPKHAEHAGLGAIFNGDDKPTPHFIAFAQAMLFRGADITRVWRSLLVEMLVIGVVSRPTALSAAEIRRAQAQGNPTRQQLTRQLLS
jgi:hypothetical protein